MTASAALDWFRQMLWTAVISAGPVVLALVTIGLLVAIVQAATQVNDQAVGFGPKAAVMVVTLTFTAPWMLQRMVEFTSSAIIAMGRLHP